MRIGELGIRADLPPKTIRYYEDAGLLPPPPRTAGGYRDYDASAVDRLGFIRAAQALGFTLGEIREILAFRDRGESPCAHVSDLIERRAGEIAGRIRRLQAMEQDLRRLTKRARSMPRTTGGICHLIEGV